MHKTLKSSDVADGFGRSSSTDMLLLGKVRDGIGLIKVNDTKDIENTKQRCPSFLDNHPASH